MWCLIVCVSVCIYRWAFGWCMFLTFLLVLGTKESSTFNLIITVAHLVLVVFIIIAGE